MHTYKFSTQKCLVSGTGRLICHISQWANECACVCGSVLYLFPAQSLKCLSAMKFFPVLLRRCNDNAETIHSGILIRIKENRPLCINTGFKKVISIVARRPSNKLLKTPQITSTSNTWIVEKRCNITSD